MTRVHFHSVNRYLRAITVKHVDFLCLSPELRVFTDITHCFFPHCAVSSKWNPSLCSLPPQAYFHFPVVCSRKCGSPKLGPTLYPPSLPGNGVPLPASHRQTISAAVAHCRRPPTSLRLQDTIISCPHCSVSASLALFWSILHTVTGAIFFFIKRQVWSCHPTASNSLAAPVTPSQFTSPECSGSCQTFLPHLGLHPSPTHWAPASVLFSVPLICCATVFPLYLRACFDHHFAQFCSSFRPQLWSDFFQNALAVVCFLCISYAPLYIATLQYGCLLHSYAFSRSE